MTNYNDIAKEVGEGILSYKDYFGNNIYDEFVYNDVHNIFNNYITLRFRLKHSKLIIYHVAVSENHRTKGLFTLLLNYLEKRVKYIEINTVVNRRLAKFLIKNNYEKKNFREHYVKIQSPSTKYFLSNIVNMFLKYLRLNFQSLAEESSILKE